MTVDAIIRIARPSVEVVHFYPQDIRCSSGQPSPIEQGEHNRIVVHDFPLVWINVYPVQCGFAINTRTRHIKSNQNARQTALGTEHNDLSTFSEGPIITP